LKGTASFLSHFSSSVTASQPLSRTAWTASRVCPAFLLELSFTADESERFVAARRRGFNLLRLEHGCERA
jgi:hypothetical protein